MAAESNSAAAAATASAAGADAPAAAAVAASASGAAAPPPTTAGPDSADKKGPRGSVNSKKKPSINTQVVDKATKPEEEQADALLKKKRESQLKRQSMPEQLKATLSDMKEKNANK